jgi:Prokaryotic lipoprotein-attachment site
MRRRGRAGRLLLAIAPLAFAALALGACGQKGPPVAPERRLPQPVRDLAGVVREDAIELTWTNPRRRVDGSALADLATARIFRTEGAGTGEVRPAVLARGRIPGYTEIATLALDEVESTDGRLLHTDRHELAAGRRYTYVIVTADSRRRDSAPSARVSVTYVAAPPAVQAVMAEAGDGEARLSWTAPTSLRDGSPSEPLAYDVLRAPHPDGPLVSVGRTDDGVTEFVDRGLQNDQTYTYSVRGLRTAADTRAYGPLSARVAVTPVDMTPPAAPTDVVAIVSPGAVRVSWRASPDADVATYVVYRAASGRVFERVGSTRATVTTFTDPEVAPGSYRYAVAAQDGGSRANESPRSSEAVVTVP